MVSNTDNTLEIYVHLLDEGTTVWRPTRAANLGNGVFKILPTPDYDPEDETWEFLPNTLVRIAERTLSSEKVWAAVEQVA